MRPQFLILSFGLIGLVLFAGGYVYGQTTIYSMSQLLQPLDNTGGSARAMAMGSAFVAVADDSSALLWNPAGLGDLSEGQIALHHNSWLVNTFQESLVFGMPMGDIGGVGAMVNYFDYGAFKGRDSGGLPTPDYSADQMGFMVGWGKEWVPGFDIGLALSGDLQSAPNESFGSIAGSAGILFSPDPRFRFGASLVNFGGYQAGNWVAAAIQIGFSYKPDLGKPHSLLLALGGTLEPQGVNRYEFGAEYAFQAMYFLRAGYQVFDQNNGIQGLQGLTLGAGIRLSDFELDYAFLPYGDLGTSNRISLSYQFPAGGKGSVPSTAKPKEKANAGPPPTVFKPKPGPGPNQKVMVLQFDIPSDLVSQGQTLDAQGKMVEAMGLYQEEIKQNAQDLMAWWDLGADYYKLGQKAYAIQCFEQVQKLKPDDKAFSEWLEKYKAQTP